MSISLFFKYRVVLFKSFLLEKKHSIKCLYRKFIIGKRTFYNPSTHTGDLPVRVLKHNVTYWLQTVSPQFYVILINQIQNNGLQAGLEYDCDRQKIIHAARVNAASINSARKISIYETFNAYLWGICYSLFVTFDEVVQKPHLRGTYSGKFDVSNQQVDAAKNVFFYAMSLKDKYSSWDKKLPNPESFSCKYAYYVERTNSLFTSAMYFVLCHEIGHSYYNHVNYVPATASQSLQEELDADNFALDQVMSCNNKELIPTLKHGAVAGMCALLFLSPKLYQGGTYPDADSRIRNVMEKLELKDLDLQWGMASLAFRLWGNYYGIDFDLPKTSENYSETFYDILFKLNEIKRNE